MNVKEMSDLVGSTAKWQINEISIWVTIVDSRFNFNRVDCLITPVRGEGQKWVAMDSLTLGERKEEGK